MTKISAKKFNQIAARHNALKGSTLFAAQLHVYRDGEAVVRRVYSHKNHNLPAVEMVSINGKIVEYRCA